MSHALSLITLNGLLHFLMSIRPWFAMPGALALWVKRPPPSLRAYALVQVISCCYYGLYENTASEADYRVSYVLLTVIATTLAGWEVVRMFATLRDRFLGWMMGAGALATSLALHPRGTLDEHILLIQAAGAVGISVALALALLWFPYKLIPGTLAGLFLGVGLFWFSWVLKPSWRDHWDWIAPVWMHTAAYTWLGWKLKWN
jgi:hypothetical protein